MIKLMAQKLLNSSFNSSFNYSSNKYFEQKKNKYFKESKYDENKNLILGETNLQNYNNILKIETNKLKTEQRYISNKHLIKKKNVCKKTIYKIKKRNSFIDISTTKFDSSWERSSSFNKSNILANSAKRMNISFISIPFFSKFENNSL